MLVLGRRIDERIVINGGEIVITVTEVRGDAVRLGFAADPSIRIDREEVHQARLGDDDGRGPGRGRGDP